jgi:hypothetical protein
MTIYKYPLILEEHYNDFRTKLIGLPELYELWQTDVQRRKLKDQRSHDDGGTFDAIDVVVRGGAFMKFCTRRNEPLTVATLYLFASQSEN